MEACALALRFSLALRAAGRFRRALNEPVATRGSNSAPDLRQSRRAAGNSRPEPSTPRNLLRAEVGPKHASWDRILEKNTLALAKKRVPRHARCEASGAPQHPHQCTICSLKGLLVPLGQQTRFKRGAHARVVGTRQAVRVAARARRRRRRVRQRTKQFRAATRRGGARDEATARRGCT